MEATVTGSEVRVLGGRDRGRKKGRGMCRYLEAQLVPVLRMRKVSCSIFHIIYICCRTLLFETAMRSMRMSPGIAAQSS